MHCDPKEFWEHILWTENAFFFLEGLESRYVRCKTNTTLNKKKIISTDKHGGGSVMVFAASGSGKLIEP